MTVLGGKHSRFSTSRVEARVHETHGMPRMPKAYGKAEHASGRDSFSASELWTKQGCIKLNIPPPGRGGKVSSWLEEENQLGKKGREKGRVKGGKA